MPFLAPEVLGSMHLPPLQLISESHFFISGDVTIHPSAAIAPGVLLQADPSSKITIAAGVCIGAGSILHAHEGTLEIETGVTLGSGVLMLGGGKIGKNACIGSNVLIWLSSIDPEQVVAAGTLVGDTGRPAEMLDSPPAPSSPAMSPPAVTAVPTMTAVPAVPGVPRGTTPIYGQAAVSRLIAAMFPNHPSLNVPPTDQSSGNAQA